MISWTGGRCAVLGSIVLILLCLGAAGCTSVAAGVAGGGLLQWGGHTIQNSEERTVMLSLDDMERVTTAALARLGVAVVGVRHSQAEQVTTRCDFEACLVGNELIPVDVALESLTPHMTKIRVSATRGTLRPERESAEQILAYVVREATREVDRRAGLPLAARP